MQYVDIDLISRIPNIKLENPYLHIPIETNPETLQSIVIELLKNCACAPKLESEFLFDFFVQSELLTTSIKNIINKNNLNIEQKIPVEFDLKKNIPKNFHLKNLGMVSCVEITAFGVVISSYLNPITFVADSGRVIGAYTPHARNIKCLKTFNISNFSFLASSGFDTHIKISEYSNFDGKNLSSKFECKEIGGFVGHSSTVLSLNILYNQSFNENFSKSTVLENSENISKSNFFCDEKISMSDNLYDENFSKSNFNNFYNNISNDNNYLISTCYNGEIGIWDISTIELENMKSSGSFRTPLMMIGSHSHSSTGTSVINHSKFISCGMDFHLKVWDIDLASCLLSLPIDIQMTCVSYSASKKLSLVGSTLPIIELVDITSDSPCVVHKIDGIHQSGIFYADWCKSNDNYFTTGSWDGSAFLWDVRNPKKPCSVVHKGKERIMTGCWKDDVIYLGTANGSVMAYNVKQYL